MPQPLPKHLRDLEPGTILTREPTKGRKIYYFVYIHADFDFCLSVMKASWENHGKKYGVMPSSHLFSDDPDINNIRLATSEEAKAIAPYFLQAVEQTINTINERLKRWEKLRSVLNEIE